jgi:hypothetical protein
VQEDVVEHVFFKVIVADVIEKLVAQVCFDEVQPVIKFLLLSLIIK